MRSVDRSVETFRPAFFRAHFSLAAMYASFMTPGNVAAGRWNAIQIEHCHRSASPYCCQRKAIIMKHILILLVAAAIGTSTMFAGDSTTASKVGQVGKSEAGPQHQHPAAKTSKS